MLPGTAAIDSKVIPDIKREFSEAGVCVVDVIDNKCN